MNPAIEKLVSGLNPAQREAVLQTEGPAVIYAGAGSGKTRVICHRITHLIEAGVPPSSILAVTFTNKAAKEMRERVESLVGYRAKAIVVSTFHSACARFLRIFASEIGFAESFSIFDDDDQKALLRAISKQLNVPDKLLSIPNLKSRIDRLKNQGLTPDAYAEQLSEQNKQGAQSGFSLLRRFGEHEIEELTLAAYRAYQQQLKQQNAMDFNDLLLLTVQMLEEKPQVLAQLQRRFKYFMVDEFQDTNPIQFRFVTLLSSHTRNLCIVGDDDQSIYSWRGAEPAFILDFAKHYPDATVFKLEQNYRSSQMIVQAATNVIAHNKRRAPKTLWTEQAEGAFLVVKSAIDAYDEAHYISNAVIKTLDGGARLSDFAILYRTNAQSRALEDELRRRMLPYVIYGSVRFYERAEIKTLLAYLRLLSNPDDDAAFERAIASPKRGLGDKGIATLKETGDRYGLSLLKLAGRIAANEIQIPLARGLGNLKEFSQYFISWRSQLEEGARPSEVLTKLLGQIRYQEFLRNEYPEDSDDRWLNVIELRNALAEFEQSRLGATDDAFEPGADPFGDEADFAAGLGNEDTKDRSILGQFLEQALLTVEPTVVNVKAGNAEAITLMTVHSSKGLEFNRVFLAGLEEGVLPHINSLENEATVEEERRLMYVAMTRARQHLVITHISRNRFRPDIPAEPSRFLAEIPEELVSFDRPERRVAAYPISRQGWGSQGRGAEAPALPKSSTGARMPLHFGMLPHAEKEKTPSESGFAPGVKVRHKLFGVGTIEGMEKSPDGYRLSVRFPVVGVKKILHTFVSLDAPPTLHQEP